MEQVLSIFFTLVWRIDRIPLNSVGIYLRHKNTSEVHAQSKFKIELYVLKTKRGWYICENICENVCRVWFQNQISPSQTPESFQLAIIFVTLVEHRTSSLSFEISGPFSVSETVLVFVYFSKVVQNFRCLLFAEIFEIFMTSCQCSVGIRVSYR